MLRYFSSKVRLSPLRLRFSLQRIRCLRQLIRSRCTVDDVCSVATFDGMKATFCGYLCNGRSTQNVLQLVFERDKQNWETLPNLIKPRCGAAAVYCQGIGFRVVLKFSTNFSHRYFVILLNFCNVFLVGATE